MKSVVITGERVIAKKDGNWGNLFCVLYQEEYQASYRKLELNTYSEGCPKGGEGEWTLHLDGPKCSRPKHWARDAHVEFCKNNKSLKILQSRMKHLLGPSVQPGELQKEPVPKSPYSAQIPQVLQMDSPRMNPERRQIKWSGSLWSQVSRDIDQILEATLKGDVCKKLQVITTIIVTLASKRFGEEEGKVTKPPYSKNQREMRIHSIRQKWKSLTCHFQENGKDLAECRMLIVLPKPGVWIYKLELQLREVWEVLYKARLNSSPGPSGIMYKVYKNYPKLLLWLENPVSHLKKGQYFRAMEICRRDLDSQRGVLQADHPVPYHLPVECRSQ